MGPCSSAKLLFFMSNKSIKTPCVGLCSTVYGDTVPWLQAFPPRSDQLERLRRRAKRAVWLRLEQLLVQVMMAKLRRFDKACCVSN